jgi:6-phosphofructokinase 1
MRLAISTGGGDAPGLNAVIRAVVLTALSRNWEVLGIKRGFAGLLGEDDVVSLTRESVRGIAHMGGTILRTTNRGNPFKFPRKRSDGTFEEIDRSDELMANARQMGIDAMVAIGGDGSLAIANQLFDKGMRIVGVPKTIDNDVEGTVSSFGFDTAVNTATDAIDKLHSTAESHERVMVVELMGRQAGFIALNAGLAGSADVILLPEIPFDMERVCAKIAEREALGLHFSIVVVAEGAVPRGGSETFQDTERRRLGGIGDKVARSIEHRTGKETRCLVLGHLQRGGTPTTFDRLLGLRFGAAAVRFIAEGKFGSMVALLRPGIGAVPLSEVAGRTRQVNLSGDTVQTARDLGISFGD